MYGKQEKLSTHTKTDRQTHTPQPQPHHPKHSTKVVLQKTDTEKEKPPRADYQNTPVQLSLIVRSLTPLPSPYCAEDAQYPLLVEVDTGGLPC